MISNKNKLEAIFFYKFKLWNELETYFTVKWIENDFLKKCIRKILL